MRIVSVPIIVVTDNPEVADQIEHCAELESQRRSARRKPCGLVLHAVRKAFFVLVLVRADSRWFAVTHR